MFIDLHLHESAYSPDSQMTLDELVQAAREKGLGAVCITDHDSMGLAEYVKEYSREHQYPVAGRGGVFLTLGRYHGVWH